MKVLIAGWFSFKWMGATAGDLYSKDVVCDWLASKQIPFDVAFTEPFEGGVNWQDVAAAEYTHVIFVCGPFANGEPLIEFLDKFRASRLVGINLSMLQNLAEWNPFELLLERDSSRRNHPDLVFLSQQPAVPLVGVILVKPQKEYGARAQHHQANDLIDALLEHQPGALVKIDTRLDVPNEGGLRTPQEIESLIARMDVVVTTRLHGLVLALKNRVPVLAIDAIQGGAKITTQARELGWPCTFRVDDVNPAQLQQAFAYCLTAEARDKAGQCRERAVRKLADLKREFDAWWAAQAGENSGC